MCDPVLREMPAIGGDPAGVVAVVPRPQPVADAAG
jgi:hypothetical protein